MEEKERYSFEYADDGFDINDDKLVYIFDNKNNKDIVICAYMDYKQGKDLCDLLNLQDKQNQKLCRQIIKLNKENNKLLKFKEDILRVQAEPYQFYKENQQLKKQLEEKNKEIEKLSLYSEKLYKLQARIGLEERTVGDVVEELDKLRNQLELLQKENQQLKEENGYIIFADGYDENGKEIRRQEFVKYKDKFKELVEENKQFKKQISKMEETHEHIMSGEYIPANVAEKSLKLSEQSQKQLAINELERLLNECESEIYYTTNNDFEHFNELISEETVDAIPEEKLEEYIEKRIKELKGEK